MSIINKGILNSGSAYLRQVGNDWPTAQVVTTTEVIEGTNQYFTNTRVLQAVEPKLTTANVTEIGNQYFTNVRVLQAVEPKLTTANVTEVGNQYFTNVRVLQAVNPLLTTSNVIEGNNQYFTNTRVLLALIGSNVSVNDLTVAGDLIVQGNTVTLNTGILTVEDKNISLANGAVNAAAADGAGFYIQGANANLTYLASGDKFVLNKNLDVTGNAVITGDIRTNSNLIANGLIIRGIFVLDNVLTGNIVSQTTTSANIVADYITANTWVNLYSGNVVETTNLFFTNTRVLQAVEPKLTTANVTEVGNQYFTNTRARMAFTAGKGIAIQENGVIKNTGAPYDYSLNYNGTAYGNVSSTLSNILVLPGIPTTDRFLLKSLLVTNLYNNTVYVSGNILYGTGNTATFANRIPIHEGGATEFMSDTPQILNPSDIVKLQGFDTNGTPTSNIINYIITYETIDNSIDYSGTGITIPTADTSTQIYHADTTYAIFENIKLVNLTTGVVKAKLWWADANNNPLAFYVYNFPVPENASVEILQTPKRINSTDKLFVSYTGTSATNALSVFVSSRIGGVFTLGPQTTSAPSGNVLSVAFGGTEADGTTLYYTIE